MNPFSRTRKRLLAAAALLAAATAVILILPRGASATVLSPAGEQAPESAAAMTSRAPSAPARQSQLLRPALDKPASGKVFAEGVWGNGEEQFGRAKAEESNPQAPYSIRVDRQGNVYVLDQVNSRIDRFDPSGKRLPPLRVTQQAPRDLVVSPVGTVLVMDNLRDKTISVLDPEGKLIGELPIAGKHLDESGLATGIFADANGVYVEKEHAMAVRVGDAAGAADFERPLLDGRPSRDGSSLLSMGLIQAPAGRLWMRSVDRATGQLKFMHEYALPTPIIGLTFLDSDAFGRIYAAAHVGRQLPVDSVTGGSGGVGGWIDESVQLLCLDPAGNPRSVIALPPNTGSEETVQDLAVRDDGTVLYMYRTEQGLQLLQYTCG